MSGGVPTTPVPTEAPLHVVEGRDTTGDSDGGRPARTFVFLHGYGCSSYMWRRWVPAFSARGRVLLVDLKGFGDAPKPDDGRYSPYDLADAVVDFVREQELRSVTLVGQSLGGGVALLSALDLNEGGVGTVDRMILLAPAAYRQRLPPFVWLSHRPRIASALLRLAGAERVVRWTMRSVVHDPGAVTEDQVAEYARPWATREGRRAALAVGRQIVPDDLDERTSAYSTLDIPTLLLWGDDDRVVPLSIGKRLKRDLPYARLEVLKDCGHVAVEEHPEVSLRMVEDFLDATG